MPPSGGGGSANRYSPSKGYRLVTAPLEQFKGVWINAYERATYGHDGSYSIELRNLSTGDLLLAYDSLKIDLWRVGAEFVRPKWGIYRSLRKSICVMSKCASISSVSPRAVMTAHDLSLENPLFAVDI